MKKMVAIVLVVNLTLSGCSLFVPKTQTVSAACTERDATLQVNGQHFVGSGQAEVPRNKNVSIMCTKPGYFPAQKSVDHSLSGTGVLDIIGTFVFLFPGLGLFSAGAWNLDETNVNVPMVQSD